ncbi:sigma-70 family RNA polymerase sigma factor [Streptomyces sp. SL13]|uniref:Sigma-70 family RNA polymerase sigma factor n=1 Tax=Streptantibioticus silvisoli TaxID=2705255 RepID=A0AA90KBM7_9ACTN|nr:sigma-70 family RNA polymerase sigma factor [Streptantibioticus silvisoli]MDI5973527.1 sigma-70 family RNA polymerase sigma factor [Streptantibioticus silvisoli]
MTLEEPLSHQPSASMADIPLDLSAFHQMHRPTYVRWSERYLGSRRDAEEAVDQTFEELARTWQQVLMKEVPAAYAWKVMKNRTIDYARARGRRPEPCESVVFDTVDAATATDPIAAIENSMALKQAILQLSEREQDVIDLRYREGMSVAEAALQLGITEPGVRSIERYARQKLKQIIRTWETPS